MERQIIHVEPLSGYLARFGAPVSPVVRHGGLIYVSGLPPFDPSTSEVRRLPLERQAEIVIDQMALCLAAAGASPRSVPKCNVYCTSADRFAAFNAIYARTFAIDPPARIFVCVPAWPGPFDVEIDCVAAVDAG